MEKSVLLIIFLFSLVFSGDTISVKVSTLMRMKQNGIYIVCFDRGRNLRIENDMPNDAWGIEEGNEKPAENKVSSALLVGVSKDGDYFLPKSAVQKYGNSIPEVSFSPNWSIKNKMVDAGSYYVFHSGVKIFGRQAYRFFISGRQFPSTSAAEQKEDCLLLNIDQSDIANQDNGECFFYSLPLMVGLK